MTSRVLLLLFLIVCVSGEVFSQTLTDSAKFSSRSTGFNIGDRPVNLSRTTTDTVSRGISFQGSTGYRTPLPLFCKWEAGFEHPDGFLPEELKNLKFL